MIKTILDAEEIIVKIQTEPDPEFFTRAKCRQHYDSDHMFPEGTRVGRSKTGLNREEAEQEVASLVCHGGDGLGHCAVELQCLLTTMKADIASGESNGVAGGMTASQRRQRRMRINEIRGEIAQEIANASPSTC